MAALVIFGVFGYATLPVSELPNVDFPTINVQANLPGADPETMASRGGDAAGECLLHHPRRRLDDLAQLARATPTSPCSSAWTAISTPPRRTFRPRSPACTRRLPRDMPQSAHLPQARSLGRSRSSSSRCSPTPCRSPRWTNMPRPAGAPSFPPSTAWRRSISSARRRYAVRIQADPAALAARQIGIDRPGQRGRQRHNVNQATGTLNGPTKNRRHPHRRPAQQCRGIPQPDHRLSQRRAGHVRRRGQGDRQCRERPLRQTG